MSQSDIAYKAAALVTQSGNQWLDGLTDGFRRRGESCQALRSTRLGSILLIPCFILSTITALPNNIQTRPFYERCFQQRSEKRNKKRRREEAKMSNSQKQQLFETRRRWMMSTHNKQLALFKTVQNCIQKATSFAEGRRMQDRTTAGTARLL